MIASHKACVGRRVPQWKMLTQRFLLRAYQCNDPRTTFRFTFGHLVVPASMIATISVLLLTAPTPTVHSEPNPEVDGEIVLLGGLFGPSRSRLTFPPRGVFPRPCHAHRENNCFGSLGRPSEICFSLAKCSTRTFRRS